MNRAKKESIENGKEFLQKAFSCEQRVLKERILMASDTISHNGEMGAVTEENFKEVIRKYLPKRYGVDSAIIIDSDGSTSDQIDIVIYDPQYTPCLLIQQNYRYIPVESVYGILEVKQKINKETLEYASKKAESVRVLKQTSVPIAHAGGVYLPKQPLKIVAGLVGADIDWADGFGQTFRENHQKLTGNKYLDCGLAVSGSYYDTFAEKFSYVYEPSKDNALIFFLFRLLGKLQSMGTVPAIDWNAYSNALGSL